MGISAHPHLREETLCAIHHGYVSTHTSGKKPCVSYVTGMSAPIFQGRNLVCHTSRVCWHTHTSGNKLCIVHHLCVSTSTLQEKNTYVLYIMGVSAHPHFREETLHAACCGCGVKCALLRGHTALIFPTYEKSMGVSMPVAYWQVHSLTPCVCKNFG